MLKDLAIRQLLHLEITLHLHYSTNREKVDNSGLVLIDAGAEYNMYSSDVTRTFPINGKFSAPQKDVYQEVLKAQTLGIIVSTQKILCLIYIN